MTTNHVPMRTCLGCGQQRPRKELTRIVLTEGALTIDEIGRLPGRGAYLCPGGVCVNLLLKKKGKLSYSLRASVPYDEEEEFLRGIERHQGDGE